MTAQNIQFYLSLILIILLSFWIRVSYIRQTVIDNPVRGDAYYYVLYANNLVSHGTFSRESGTDSPKPDSYWAPGYPTMIAAGLMIEKKLGISSYKFIMYSQVVLGTLTAVVTLLLGRIFLSLQWAFLPALLVALSPHLISMGGYLLTETLFGFLILAAIYCFTFAFDTRKKSFFVFSGLFFGMSYLVNPVMFFLPLLLVLAAYYFYKARAKEYLFDPKTPLLYCLIVFFVIFGAWTARNIINVPPGQSSGSNRLLTNLIIGTHSDFFDIWRANPRAPNNPAGKDEKIFNGSYSAFVKQLSKRIIQNPRHYAKWYFVDKPILLWSWSIKIGQGDIYVYPVIVSLYQKSNIALATYSIMKSLHYWILGAAFLGIFLLFRRGIPRVPLFLYVTLVYISSVYVVTQAEPRYSIPFRPEMYLCAVFFISETFEYLKFLRPGKMSKVL